MASPDYGQLLDEIWGWGDEVVSPFFGASNVVVGTNPPYTATDFLNLYPQFFGPATAVTVATVATQETLTVTGTPTGLAAGQLITGPGIPYGATIVSYSAPTLTISIAATVTATGVAASVYEAPLVPLAVLMVYIALASSCLVQARWLDIWVFAMGLYVAHFATLWMQAALSNNPAATTAGQVVAAGLQRGILVSKAVGGVSGGFQVTPGLEAWGSWNLTTYGVQLATFAKVIGSGPMLIL